jgi:hypothetical protein
VPETGDLGRSLQLASAREGRFGSDPQVTHLRRNGCKRAVSGHCWGLIKPRLPELDLYQRLDQARLGRGQLFRPEAASSLPSAIGHRALEVAQLGLQRSGEACSEVHKSLAGASPPLSRIVAAAKIPSEAIYARRP